MNNQVHNSSNQEIISDFSAINIFETDFLSAIFSHLQEYLFVLDEAWFFKQAYINPKNTKYVESFFVGKHLYDIMGKEAGERILALTKSGNPNLLWTTEIIFPLNNQWHLMKLKYEADKKLYWLQLHNIHSQKKRELNLAESENRYKKLINIANEGVWIIDWEGNTTFLNPKMAQILGYTPAEVREKSFYDFVASSDLAQARTHLERREQGIDEQFDFKFLKKDGTPVWTLITTSPVKDESGEYLGAILMVSDISGRKIAEDELKKALEELSTRNFELDQLVYKISHDIRSPLSSILGLINIYKIEDNPATQLNYVGLIENRVHKLDGFVKSMLNYAKANRSEIHHELIDFEEIIHNCLADLEFLENFKRIKTKILIGQIPANFRSDKLRLQIIFANIISNAYKYMNPQVNGNYLKIKVLQDKNNLNLHFADNGIGIAAEYLPKVFDMFFRATEKSDGSGLGMYIVKQTVDKLGGGINIQSELGKGTQIDISIPIN
ncbi:MAG: PAS domain-containing sensor histidine kinase [Microscillaceae bacterium]|jgi:PAS domain S-box-containing protein|nr:PAS domain-containing sensor histidine kinase [Microscillaceae bacterium]